jgi:MoaA/NifB/PqqE/SkfB family radical SAM enzyme
MVNPISGNSRTVTRLHRVLKVLTAGSSRRWASIFFTRRCNLRCTYCRAYEQRPDDLPLSEWKRIVDKLEKWGVPGIDIVGGEPTLREDLFDLVAYINGKHMFTALHSNFTVLSEAMIDHLAASGLFLLKASVDSLDGFGKTGDRTFQLLEYAKIERKLAVMVSSVATSANIDQIQTLAQYAIEKKMFFCCGLYQCVGGRFSSPNRALIPPIGKTEEVFRFLHDLKAKTGWVRNSYLFLENTDCYYNGLWKCDPDRNAWLTINNDGTLMPCQEYNSEISILDIDSLENERWLAYKKDTVQACQGCLYHCYFDSEKVIGRQTMREVRTALNLLR